jgi:hypothetical protein
VGGLQAMLGIARTDLARLHRQRRE